ncbi:MAG: adenine deaminase C-terminal domain-containing protein, partial [Candidatus Adiutrix sp.]
LTPQNGCYVAAPDDDLLKIAVFHRYNSPEDAAPFKGQGHISPPQKSVSKSFALGFLKGLGLKSGALASTVAHDSHNLVVVGACDKDMLAAVEEIKRIGGGLAVAQNGRIIDSLPLPLGGILSDRPMDEIGQKLKSMQKAAKSLGLGDGNDPFMTLAFMSLPVIPKLKLTANGLVDVEKFKIVPLTF